MLPRAYAFREGLLQVLPRATEFPALQTMLCLALVSVAMIILPGLAVGRLRDRLSVAERRLYLQGVEPEPARAPRCAAAPGRYAPSRRSGIGAALTRLFVRRSTNEALDGCGPLFEWPFQKDLEGRLAAVVVGLSVSSTARSSEHQPAQSS